ncbi:MAG: DNA repair protein RecN [Zetaproteobacteria bacterium]|nr:DNA repair protein RecN [Zetaproteobacteria bacterium]
MLLELTVKEFVLIESMTLNFSAGMTVFTGETGAGKSVFMGALAAVFGQRANSQWVRHGAKQAEVVAELGGEDPRLRSLLEAHDIEVDDSVILRRVITADGRSKAYVNGVMFPVKLLQSIGEVCLDLHGQNEHQALFQLEYHRQLVDSYVDSDALQGLQKAYFNWCSAKQSLKAFEKNRHQSVEQEAWIRESYERLVALELSEGVLQSLEDQVNSYRHVQQIQAAGMAALQYLDEEDLSVRTLFHRAVQEVESMRGYDASLEGAAELMAQVEVLFAEIEPLLREARDVEVDYEESLAAEERLHSLHEMLRRFKTDEQGLLNLQQQWHDELSALDTAVWDEEALYASVAKGEKCFREIAATVSEARRNAASLLTERLRPFLDQLALAGMRVEVEIKCSESPEHWREWGWDEIQFLVSSNPGEPFKPLASIASGGELSRFVLALKGCGALMTLPDVAVFDEVDVGIGGETAWCVGALLAAMAEERQVFVVSHLPQVAACAGHQIHIRKSMVGDRTVTHLESLSDAARVTEIARMLGGENRESLEHAKQMLLRGRQGLLAQELSIQ